MVTQSPFVDSSYHVTDAVVLLLNLTGIAIKGESSTGLASIKPFLFLESRDITAVMQGVQGIKNPQISWLRPQHKERWQHDHLGYLTTEQFDYQRIISIAYESLKQNKEVKLSKKSYQGILLLGTTLHNFFSRVKYLLSLFPTLSKVPITVLTGHRLLDPANDETYEEWLKLIQNTSFSTNISIFPQKEAPEMIAFIMKHFGLSYQLCTTAAKPGYHRAHTQDTIEEWLRQDPAPGQYLAISSQPFVTYQEGIIQSTLQQYAPKKAAVYFIETAGPAIEAAYPSNYLAMSDKSKAFNLLDTIARVLHNLHLLRSLQ